MCTERRNRISPKKRGSLAANFALLSRDVAGVTAVEFAFIVPILLAMVVGIADLGIGIYTDMEVQNAAQYGTEYALLKGYNADAITAAVSGSSALAHITVAPSQFCGCPSESAITSSDCDSNCADGTKAGSFARVTVTDTYTTLISWPGLPASFSLRAQSTARLQ
jgi:Flp pilus assembly protein TadG